MELNTTPRRTAFNIQHAAFCEFVHKPSHPLDEAEAKSLVEAKELVDANECTTIATTSALDLCVMLPYLCNVTLPVVLTRTLATAKQVKLALGGDGGTGEQPLIVSRGFVDLGENWTTSQLRACCIPDVPMASTRGQVKTNRVNLMGSPIAVYSINTENKDRATDRNLAVSDVPADSNFVIIMETNKFSKKMIDNINEHFGHAKRVFLTTP